jgi:hypothetical protein
MKRLLSTVLPLLIVLANGPPRASADEPPLTFVGSLRYVESGPMAAQSGWAAGIMWGSAVAPVAGVRLLSGLGALSSLGENATLARLYDQLRSTVPVDLAGLLPISARYDARVTFALVQVAPNRLALQQGALRWTLTQQAELSGEGTVISDQFVGQGEYALNTEHDKIDLTFDLRADEPTFALDVAIAHPMPINGLSRWSALAGLVQLDIRAQNGIETFGGQSFGEPIPPEVVSSEPGTHAIAYSRSGTLDQLSGTETWRDVTDTQLLVSYQIADRCYAVIDEPPHDGRLTAPAEGERSLEGDLRATVLPDVHASQLEWTLPPFAGHEPHYDPDDRRGADLRFWFDAPLPGDNAAWGPYQLEAAFVEAAAQACEAVPARQVRLFFSRDAHNNPDGNVPNWFYYWQQTPAGQGHGAAMRYDPAEADWAAFRGYGNTWLADRIYLSNLFRDGELLLVNPLTGQVTTGIDAYAVVVRHEWQHLRDYAAWWGQRGYQQLTEDAGDRDKIPDALEPALGFNPKLFDTPGLGLGDAEYSAYRAEAGWRIGAANAQDWADPGKQSR